MGEVYEAEDTVKDRMVALKLLPEALSNDPMFRERLQREARATSTSPTTATTGCSNCRCGSAAIHTSRSWSSADYMD
jgi:serine/threonine protein kinase